MSACICSSPGASIQCVACHPDLWRRHNEAMTPYDWPPTTLARIRADVLTHAGLPRHSFGARWTDAPSIQPERVPVHRRGMHRANVPVDSCPTCRAYAELTPPFHGPIRGKRSHRAEVAA